MMILKAEKVISRMDLLRSDHPTRLNLIGIESHKRKSVIKYEQRNFLLFNKGLRMMSLEVLERLVG